MTNAALRAIDEPKLQILSEGEVRAVLQQHNPSTPASDLRAMAKIITIVSGVFAELPEAKRREIARGRDKFRTALIQAASHGRRQTLGRVRIKETGKIEKSRGSGLGERIGVDEGRERLDRYATTKPLESWAGPVAGAGELEASLGIPRSTLSFWQQRGAVIGLLRGERKLAYPIAQFVDARPLEGIADILRVTPDARSAWLWLGQPHGALQDRSPLDVLKSGEKELVVRVAERDFV